MDIVSVCSSRRYRCRLGYMRWSEPAQVQTGEVNGHWTSPPCLGHIRPYIPAVPYTDRLPSCLAGGLLLMAAGLKAHQAVLYPAVEPGLLEHWWLGLQIPLEIGLGLALVSGIRPRWTGRVAILAFTGFIGVTAMKAWHGAASCGCFGVVTVPPWLTLVVDGIVVAALIAAETWRWRTPQSETSGVGLASRRTAFFAVVWLVMSLPAAALVATAVPDRLDGAETWSRVAVLDPPAWAGRRLPIIDHLKTEIDVMQGRWRLILYRRDCPHCRTEVPRRLERYRHDPAHGRRIGLVELPPIDPEKAFSDFIPATVSVARLELTAARDWFVPTPAEVDLDDGTVVAGRLAGDPALRRLVQTGDASDWPLVAAANDTADLGYVPPDRIRRIRLQIPDGNGPYEFATSSCACLEALPLDDGTVVIAFHAPNEPTEYGQRLMLSDRTGGQRKLLRVTAGVGRPLVVSPHRLSLAVGDEAVVRIRNRGSNPVRLLFSSASTRAVAIVRQDQVLPQRGSAMVVCRADQTGQGALTITTDCKKQGSLVIPVHVVEGRPAAP